jgi:RES domain
LRYVKGPPPKGWRFNDLTTEILYAAEVEALATLEVAVRPGWESIQKVLIATMEIPDGSLANFSDLKIRLPSNWNSRPATDDSRLIAREFLNIQISGTPLREGPLSLLHEPRPVPSDRGPRP